MVHGSGNASGSVPCRGAGLYDQGVRFDTVVIRSYNDDAFRFWRLGSVEMLVKCYSYIAGLAPGRPTGGHMKRRWEDFKRQRLTQATVCRKTAKRAGEERMLPKHLCARNLHECSGFQKQLYARKLRNKDV